ncbi:hypothetical protein FBU30_005551 [Linnemannia zychae]|nr:hypothetical protein FBU30_005551 [Linnemannia zychae]
MPIATINLFNNSNNSTSSLEAIRHRKGANGSSSRIRYNNHDNSGTTLTTPSPSTPASLFSHQFESDSNSTSHYTFGHSPSLTPMTTDDESPSSFRPRPRQLSKPSAMPSPLGTSSTSSNFNNSNFNNSNYNNSNYNKGNGSSLALSSFPFFSTSDKSNTVPHLNDPYNNKSTNNNNNSNGNGNSNTHITQNPPPTGQLRVRHLQHNLTYAGYLTKFSSRTFFSRKQWKRRYFILTPKSLHCFKSSDPQHPLLESITLCPDTIICVTDMFAGKRFCLQISCPGEKNWYVLADTATEMSGWLRELKGTVQRVRTLDIDLRPPTLYSESSEISDMSSSSGLHAIPSVPPIPSQYETLDGHPRSLSPSPRHGNPSSSHFYNAHSGLDQYHGQATSLSPPPRPISPKPSTPTPGSGPQYQQQRTQGSLQSHSQGQASNASTTSDPMPVPEPRRRRNSSLSNGQPATDYASFGSVMARAEALAEAQRGSSSSSWSIPTKFEGNTGSATLPRSKRDSSVSTMSGMSTTSHNQRMSVMTDHSEAFISHRNSQRSMGGNSRPMSPASSRPLSPNMTRVSPRNSLVIAPPPRSIHRPTSVSIRHSTQILPPPQIITAGLSSKNSIVSPLGSNPPTSTLPATPDAVGNNNQLLSSGSLSRITSIRNQRDLSINRQSVANISSSITTGAGSLQERVQRSSSRTNVMRPSMPSITTGNLVLPLNRPLSPTPSLSSAPTLPLPQPPRSNSSSPSKEPAPSNASISSQSSSTTTQSQSSEPAQRRASSVPRQQNSELTTPQRSKARGRSASHEAAVLASKLSEIQLTRKASTPSPRLSAVIPHTQVSSPTSPNSGSGNESSHRHLRQMSLPLQTMYVLPDPPTREAPIHPAAGVSTNNSRPHRQRSTSSNGTLRPLSLAIGQQVPSLGGGVARRSSNASSTISGGSSKDSTAKSNGNSTAVRHSVQIVPLQTVLPAPPTTALPSKPNEAGGAKKAKKISAHQANISTTSIGSAGTGFGAIIEEEDEDDEDGEFRTSLPFEELEAVKRSTEQELDQDSTATTPTTSLGTRPEYYATKQRTVVDYIFPSEAFSA